MIEAILANPLGEDNRRDALKVTAQMSEMKEYSMKQREADLKTEEDNKVNQQRELAVGNNNARRTKVSSLGLLRKARYRPGT